MRTVRRESLKLNKAKFDALERIREIENQNRRNYLDKCSSYAFAFQRKHLPWFPTGYIDKVIWRNSGLETQLREALKKADSMTLEALSVVGLKGQFSNSVESKIRKIMKEASRNPTI